MGQRVLSVTHATLSSRPRPSSRTRAAVSSFALTRPLAEPEEVEGEATLPDAAASSGLLEGRGRRRPRGGCRGLQRWLPDSHGASAWKGARQSLVRRRVGAGQACPGRGARAAPNRTRSLQLGQAAWPIERRGGLC